MDPTHSGAPPQQQRRAVGDPSGASGADAERGQHPPEHRHQIGVKTPGVGLETAVQTTTGDGGNRPVDAFHVGHTH